MTASEQTRRATKSVLARPIEGSTEREQQVVVNPQGNGVYHTNPNCNGVAIAKAPRIVDRSDIPDWIRQCESCQKERTDFQPVTPENLRRRDQCTTCDGELDADGTCTFCQRFDLLLG